MKKITYYVKILTKKKVKVKVKFKKILSYYLVKYQKIKLGVEKVENGASETKSSIQTIIERSKRWCIYIVHGLNDDV